MFATLSLIRTHRKKHEHYFKTTFPQSHAVCKTRNKEQKSNSLKYSMSVPYQRLSYQLRGHSRSFHNATQPFNSRYTKTLATHAPITMKHPFDS